MKNILLIVLAVLVTGCAVAQEYPVVTEYKGVDLMEYFVRGDIPVGNAELERNCRPSPEDLKLLPSLFANYGEVAEISGLLWNGDAHSYFYLNRRALFRKFNKEAEEYIRSIMPEDPGPKPKELVYDYDKSKWVKSKKYLAWEKKHEPYGRWVRGRKGWKIDRRDRKLEEYIASYKAQARTRIDHEYKPAERARIIRRYFRCIGLPVEKVDVIGCRTLNSLFRYLAMYQPNHPNPDRVPWGEMNKDLYLGLYNLGSAIVSENAKGQMRRKFGNRWVLCTETSEITGLME